MVCHGSTYFASDLPHDGLGSPDSHDAVGLETFGDVEGVHIWKDFALLCAVEVVGG